MLNLGMSVTDHLARPAAPPAAFSAGDWALCDGLGAEGDSLVLTVGAMPEANGAPILAIEYRLDQGAGYGPAMALPPSRGAQMIRARSRAAASVQLRCRNAAGRSDWSAAKTVTPSAGSALRFAAFSGEPRLRPADGAVCLAAASSAAAALAALDAGARLAPAATAAGASLSLGANGEIAYGPAPAHAGLAPGATAADSFGLVVAREPGELVGRQRAVSLTGFTQSGSAYVKATAGTTATLILMYDGSGGSACRLAPGQTLAVRLAAQFSGGVNRQLRLRVQSASVVYAETSLYPAAGAAQTLAAALAIPADAPTFGLRVVVQCMDAAATGSLWGLSVSGRLAEAATGQVTVIGGAPPAAPAFRVADAVEGGKLWLWLDPDWPGWAAGRAVRWRIGEGGASSPLTAAGLHAIAGLTDGAPVSVSVSGDGAAWTAAQEATPTAPSFARFAAWADGEHHADLAAYPAVERIGVSTAAAAAINRPLALASGAEIEYIGGAGSVFLANFGRTQYPQSAAAIREIRFRHYDPLGRHDDLAPLASRTDPFKVRAAGDGADADGAAVVLGGCGAVTQGAVSVIGLDGDGDPVRFDFDRRHEAGRLRDGRPYVVAPAGVTLIANGGKQTVAAGRIATWRGAQLAVVAAAGQVPHLTEAVTLTTAYARPAGAFDWSGWGAPTLQGSGLTIQTQFESLHLYLQSASAAATEVRFRKAGTSEWFPAQPLAYDARTPGVISGVDEAAVTPGNHRGVIVHLEAGVSYDVQVKQGTVFWAGTAATEAWKVPKTSSALGTIDGAHTISAGGTESNWREYRDGAVRGGQLLIDADYVILRDVDALGSNTHAIRIADGRHHVRIVRGRIAGFGMQAPPLIGWCKNNEAGVYLNHAATASHSVAVLGARFGSPRYPANAWTEYNPEVGSVGPQAGFGNHPWGAVAVANLTGSHLGGIALIANSVQPHRLRNYNDGLVSGNGNGAESGKGGVGPNSLIAFNCIEGHADDGFEHEGLNQNGVVLGNWVRVAKLRDCCLVRSGIALASPYWGSRHRTGRNIR